MKRIGLFIGRAAFWVGLPVLWIYLGGSKRTRILMVCGDEFLALRGWLSAGDWSLPGGGLHEGENSLQGLIREVREEISIQLFEKDVKFLFHGTHNDKGIRFNYDCYAVTLPKKPMIELQKTEIAEYAWISIQNPDKKLTKDTEYIRSQWQKKA